MRTTKHVPFASGKPIGRTSNGLQKLIHHHSEIKLRDGNNHVKMIGHQYKRLNFNPVHDANKKTFMAKNPPEVRKRDREMLLIICSSRYVIGKGV